MGLSVNVSDSNSKSPALKRPIDAVVGTAKMNKESPVKDIWLIRHGESEHNTASDWGIRDPGLTDQGWKQAKALKHEPLLKGALGQYEGTEQMVELILVSPLRRTLQTAQAINEIMRSLNAAKSQKVPIIAVSDLQETSDSPCDTGHPAHLLGAEFPEVDFGSVAEDWFDKQAKWNYSTADRVTRFSEWIASRPERTILCIGHLDFFHQLVGVRLRNCGVAKYEFSAKGWRQHAVSDTQKSVVSHWVNSMREKSASANKFDLSNLLSETKNNFSETLTHEASWLTQSKAHSVAQSKRDSIEIKKADHQAKDVAELLFAEVLRRAGLSATAVGIPRKDLLQTLKDMDFDTGLVQRLVTHLSSASRSRQWIGELNHVLRDDFIATVCQDHFWKVRETALKKRAAWRSMQDDDAPAPLSAPPQGRYSAYAGVAAYDAFAASVLTPAYAAHKGPSSEGLRHHEAAFDRLQTPGGPKSITHPKDKSLRMRVWDVDDGAQGADADAANSSSNPNAGKYGALAARRPLSALSIARPASAALSLSSADLSLIDYPPGPLPDSRELSEHRSLSNKPFATATPMLSKRLGIRASELMLLEDDDPAANTTATANASHTSSRPATATATAKRPATATAKDTLRGEARTPGTAATAGAAAAQSHAAARGEALLSASPSGYWPASTQSIQSVQRGSPPNYKTLKTPAPARPAQEGVRARSPQGAQEPLRPKSALRFLPAEEFTHTIELNKRALAREEFLSEFPKTLTSLTVTANSVERSLGKVRRDFMVTKEAARDEVRRLMTELDAERHITQNLSLTLDQKNRKIQELTQALKAEQDANRSKKRDFTRLQRTPVTRQ